MKAAQASSTRLFIVATLAFLVCFAAPAMVASPVAAKVGTGILKVPDQYPIIQAAIDAASPGDKVLVAPGIYVESIQLKSGVTVEGSGADVTTLQGDGSWLEDPYFTYTVLGDNYSAISGFKITGSLYGILCNGSSPTISNNIITGNRYGIDVVWEALPTIDNNTITGNDWYGIEVVYSSPVIKNNIISGSDYAMRIWGSDPIVANNVIAGNRSGGIDSKNESPSTIINNTIVGNGGFGIRALRNTHPLIANNIIADHRGYGIICEENSHPEISYNDLWNNGTNYFGCSAGPSDISADPMFVSPATGDYHLAAGSPAIDAGTNEAPALPPVDFDGERRIVDGDFDGQAIVDMGAFEFQVISAKVNIEPKTLNLKDKGKWVKADITLPKPYLAADIDIGTVTLNGLPADNEEYSVEKHKLKLRFDRAAVENIVEPGEVEFWVTGKVGGLIFAGSDRVKIIFPNPEKTGKNFVFSISDNV